MSDDDYIRRAVELAEGWFFENHAGQQSDYIRSLSGYRSTVQAHDEILDALAAQLVRQVDASTCDFASLCEGYAAVYLDTWGNEIVTGQGNDRTMNAIRAIVDSGVLEKDDE